MIMADSSRKFINNQDLNEQNSFTHLLESINPESEEEVNPINHSAYFSNNEFDGILRQNTVVAKRIRTSILNPLKT